MSTETNQDAGAQADKSAGEGSSQSQADTLSIPRTEYEAFVKDRETLGSLKREFKDFRKSLEQKSQETPQTTPDSSSSLLKKAFLQSSGITDAEEQELALSTAKKWGVEVDQLINDEDWKSKLDKHRVAKANATATSNISGSPASASHTKESTAYWKAKGVPPTPNDIPDRKTRQKIIRELVGSAGNKGIQFYNE